MSLGTPLLRLAVLALAAALLGPSPSYAYDMLYASSNEPARGDYVSCINQNGFAHWPWNQGTIYWYYNSSGAGTFKAWAIRQALATWTNAAESDHVLSYAGTTNAGYNINDNQNTISWGSVTQSELCGTMACHAITAFRHSSQVLLEADIVLNELMDWRTDGTYDETCRNAKNPDGTPRYNVALDTQAIVTHELGHTLGLHESSNLYATMGGASCTPDGRTLHADDLAGLRCTTSRYPLNPGYEGYFDGVPTFSCSQISGWAWNANRADDPVYVSLRDGSVPLSLVLADKYRADLYAAGKGNGYHGFTYTPPANFRDGRWHTLRAFHTGGTEPELAWSQKNLICNVSIFSQPTPVPAEYVDNGGKPYTLGNIITSSVDGVITRLRYYKPVEESGPHTLKLWTLSGQPLATGSANFNAGVSGWVEADIPDTRVTKDTQYMVTVTTYIKSSKTACSLSTSNPATNGPLKATGSGWGEGDGVFPNVGSCSNFWTDVVFDM